MPETSKLPYTREQIAKLIEEARYAVGCDFTNNDHEVTPYIVRKYRDDVVERLCQALEATSQSFGEPTDAEVNAALEAFVPHTDDDTESGAELAMHEALAAAYRIRDLGHGPTVQAQPEPTATISNDRVALIIAGSDTPSARDYQKAAEILSVLKQAKGLVPQPWQHGVDKFEITDEMGSIAFRTYVQWRGYSELERFKAALDAALNGEPLPYGPKP